MSKVYGYCRLALADEKGMAQQVELIEDYCRDHSLTLDKCFCDTGVSGLNSYRDGLNEMLYAVQDDDTVIVRDMARFSRDINQCMSLIELLEKLNVTLIIID